MTIGGVRVPIVGGWSTLAWLGAAAALALCIALVSVWRSRHHGHRAKTVWTIIVVLLPLLGPLAWFVLGHERGRE